MTIQRLTTLIITLLLAGCSFGFDPNAPSLDIITPTVGQGGQPSGGETGTVTNVIDGDTIDVNINGVEYRIRYVGVNTPERDEVCYSEATQANAAMVQGQTVRLVKDVSETDRYDRLLRYVYVGNTFVNAQLVSGGFAEAVLYEPDRAQYNNFRDLEFQAAAANLGCHSTGIFDDNSDTR